VEIGRLFTFIFPQNVYRTSANILVQVLRFLWEKTFPPFGHDNFSMTLPFEKTAIVKNKTYRIVLPSSLQFIPKTKL
jgi:hypothetical protein